MFALMVDDKVLIFDQTKHYGLYDLYDVNLEGYLKVLEFKDVLLHYENNYYEQEKISLERYLGFLFRICINYLRDFQYL